MTEDHTESINRCHYCRSDGVSKGRSAYRCSDCKRVMYSKVTTWTILKESMINLPRNIRG